jgi:predicted DCC family thiol-disulfide oxidoreductase YuxK
MIFDGHCVLCSSGVVWMLSRDPHGASRFATIQSPLPQALYRHYGLDADNFETFMVLADGIPYLRWSGWLAGARAMPAPWRWLGSAGRIVPDFVGDRVYDWVQRNRFDWFGKRSTCFLPDAEQKRRFLECAEA